MKLNSGGLHGRMCGDQVKEDNTAEDDPQCLMGYDLKERLLMLRDILAPDPVLDDQLDRVSLLSVVLMIAAFLAAYWVQQQMLGDPFVMSATYTSTQHSAPANPGINTYRSIVKETVPFVQQWFARLGNVDNFLPMTPEASRLNLMSNPLTMVPTDTTNCLQETTDLGNISLFVTRNETMLALERMGLLEVPVVVELLGSLLQDPQTSGKEDIFKSSNCLAGSRVLSELLCKAIALTPADKPFTERIFKMAVILESLTNVMMDNFYVLKDVIEHMEGKQRDLYKQTIEGRLAKNLHAFYMYKYDGITASVREYLESVASNQHRGLSSVSQLQLNILEAVKVDIEKGFHDNARVGIALAASLSRGRTNIEPLYEDNRMSWPVSKQWVEAYIAWNLAFLAGIQEVPFFVHAYMLLIPSVLCEVSTPHGENFVAHRLVSLALFLMGFNEQSLASYEPNNATASTELARFAGKRNLHTLKIPSPSQETVEYMFFDLCDQGKACLPSWRPASESSPTFEMDEEQHKIYVAIVVSITMILAGYGLEQFRFRGFQTGLDVWTSHTNRCWKLAQFAFAPMAVASLLLAFSRNPLSFFTTILGLWKFGFPECVSYFCVSLYGLGLSPLHRLAEFLNGVGTLNHHAAASFIIAMMLAGVLEPSWHVSDPILVLVMQHWFTPLRYSRQGTYVVVGLVLEVFFEWFIFAHLEFIHSYHWTGATGALVMLFSHWFCLIAAALDMFIAYFPFKAGYTREGGGGIPRYQEHVDEAATEDIEDSEGSSVRSTDCEDGEGNSVGSSGCDDRPAEHVVVAQGRTTEDCLQPREKTSVPVDDGGMVLLSLFLRGAPP